LISPPGLEETVNYYKNFKFITVNHIDIEEIKSIADGKLTEGDNPKILKFLDYNYWTSFFSSALFKTPSKYKVYCLDKKNLGYPLYVIAGTNFQGARGSADPPKNGNCYDIFENFQEDLFGNVLILRQDCDNHDTRKLFEFFGHDRQYLDNQNSWLHSNIKWYLNQVKYLTGGKMTVPYLAKMS